MTKVQLLLLLLVIVNECLQKIGGADTRKFKRRKDCKMKSENIIEQKVTDSLSECLVVCGYMDCQTVSWSTESSSCLVSNVNVIHDRPSIDVKWEVATSWETYTRVVLEMPIARYLNPDAETDYLTYEEANVVCANSRATVASEADLLAWLELDRGVCWCAWISNVEAAVPIRNGTQCLHYSQEIGPKIFYCDKTKAGVWCKLH